MENWLYLLFPFFASPKSASTLEIRSQTPYGIDWIVTGLDIDENDGGLEMDLWEWFSVEKEEYEGLGTQTERLAQKPRAII